MTRKTHPDSAAVTAPSAPAATTRPARVRGARRALASTAHGCRALQLRALVAARGLPPTCGNVIATLHAIEDGERIARVYPEQLADLVGYTRRVTRTALLALQAEFLVMRLTTRGEDDEVPAFLVVSTEGRPVPRLRLPPLVPQW